MKIVVEAIGTLLVLWGFIAISIFVKHFWGFENALLVALAFLLVEAGRIRIAIDKKRESK